MIDQAVKKLDQEILKFIKNYSIEQASWQAFETLALKVFVYQYENNSPYRKFCKLQKKTPKNIASWKEIPAMPTEGFKELALRCFSSVHTVKTFKTSGTTTEKKGQHYFDTMKLYEASIIPPFQKYLMPDSSEFKFFFLTSSPDEAPWSSLGHMMGVVNKTFRNSKGKFYIRKGQILAEELYEGLKKSKKPVMILTTAFSLKGFLNYLDSRKLSLKLKPGSRIMETGGFKGRIQEVSKQVLYEECRQKLGIDPKFCISEYGMTELSSQFYDTVLNDLVSGIKREPFKAGPAWLRTVVVDSATGKEVKNGEMGILRHFDLANRGSVMAIQTEDLGIKKEEGFELVGRAPQSALRGCSLAYEALLGDE